MILQEEASEWMASTRTTALVFLLLFPVLVSVTPARASAAVFKDVPPSHWVYSLMDEMGERGVFATWEWRYDIDIRKLPKWKPVITRYEMAQMVKIGLERLEQNRGLRERMTCDIWLDLLRATVEFRNEMKVCRTSAGRLRHCRELIALNAIDAIPRQSSQVSGAVSD